MSRETDERGNWVTGFRALMRGFFGAREEKALDTWNQHFPGASEDPFQQATILFDSGDLARARTILERELNSKPEQPSMLVKLAEINHAQGDALGALGIYRRALAIEPENSLALRCSGKLLVEHGDVRSGLEQLEKASSFDPNNADNHYALGRALHGLGRLDEAAARYSRALEIEPEHLSSNVNLGILRRGQGIWSEALKYLKQAVRVKSGDVHAHFNLGTLCAELGELASAEKHLKIATGLAPDLADAHASLAGVLNCMGRFNEAEEAIDKCLELSPDSPEAHWQRALLKSYKGEFRNVWGDYEFGLQFDARQPRTWGFPRWNGGSLSGKTILLVPEQGIGDQIMFASCIPDLLEDAAPDRCILDCDRRLVPMFRRSFPGLLLPEGRHDDDRKWVSELLPVDVQLPLGSLPLHFRNDPECFNQDCWLKADPTLVSKWKAGLDSLGEQSKVGISWRGGATIFTKNMRSVSLDQWKPIFSLKGVHFIDLQYDSTDEEIEHASREFGIQIHHFSKLDPMKDLEEQAALIASLDLVVSVDNSTVHLAGALGVPVWTMLAKVPDWRWTIEGQRSLWYPSMRLFRQSEAGNWAEVLEKISDALRERSGR